ncbi:MAG: hypothetical protein JXR40_14190 [Pontiellaceae bacterium]|nr:hypothetical protein [Pontiellaceae bacterium]
MEKYIPIILAIPLTLHFFSQRLLLNKGMKSEDPTPIIKRLAMNGILLAVLAAITLILGTKSNFGLLGLLILFEAAACMGFALKLSKRK